VLADQVHTPGRAHNEIGRAAKAPCEAFGKSHL
jgi:hypothetical protein